MNAMTIHRKAVLCAGLLLGLSLLALPGLSAGAVMQDYCILPPFVAQSVPPMVMFDSGREHKLFYEAYNDAADFDEDGRLDVDYKHSIVYYGYFDPYKCYTYASTGTGQFNPASVTVDKFCSTGQWSGNVLNWMAMSRMDTLKKVLFGGQRQTDSNVSTVLERAYIPQDAHSWGKELTGRLCYNGTTYTYNCKRDSDCESGETCVDKSENLIGIAVATPPFDCSFTSAIGDINSKMLVARYSHSNSSVGVDHADLMSSFEVSSGYIDHSLVTDFNDALFTLTTSKFNYYNIFVTSEFNVVNADRGNWQFLIDSDDGAEVEICAPTGGVCNVVSSYYGLHAYSNAPTTIASVTQSGTINLNSAGYWKMNVRQTERTGNDGVKVWYKKPGAAAWTIYPSGLTYRAPNVGATAGCTLQSDQFIAIGEPQIGTPGGQHLFCSTTLSDGGTPIIRKITNNTHRIWEWASKERPVCDTTFSDGTATGTIDDFTVRVKVCDTSVGVESNCKNYSGTYKPIGLLQKYGENTTGAQVCSKTQGKPCNSDSDCVTATEGTCLFSSPMYFGFMTTSYTNNLRGGVLRKNIGSIMDETNINNGTLQTSEPVGSRGNFFVTFDRIKPIGFRYSDQTYQDADGGTCGWITTRPLANGECRDWGNPIGELLYENMRYFAGKGTPTAAFEYAGSQDSGLNLSHPTTWGFSKGATLLQPYEMFPACSRPFVLLLSDINTSADLDNMPTDLAGLNAANLTTLMDTIGATEGIHGQSWFVGESGANNDFICTAKAVTNLSLVKGTCPEEPTKKGTYASAAVAYYGKTLMQANNAGKPNVDTFVVALSSPVADLKIKAGSNYVTIVPTGKSVSGCNSVNTACRSNCTLSYNATRGLQISGCNANAYCPTNQIVDVFADSVRYNAANDVIYAKYRINFEDVEQGADHDMDAIVTYEICTNDAVTAGYGSCGTALAANQIQIKLSSDYAAGCLDQVIGFVISGTTEDGVYLPVKDLDIGNASDGDTPAVVAGMPTTFSHIFNTTGAASTFLKNPLWYAAKWGGFDDNDGDGRAYSSSTCGTASPNSGCQEWDKNSDGDPDNYFLVTNPLKLEDQLNKALMAILARASSGTAASVLASSEGRGANIVQALFHPRKTFDNDTAVEWAGQLSNLWYYIDPRLQSNTIREDTDLNKVENLINDWQIRFRFDPTVNRTVVDRYRDTNSNGVPDTFMGTVDIDDVKSIWEAGKKLFERNLSTSPRTIRTTLSSTYPFAFQTFTDTDAAAGNLQPYLQATSLNQAKDIIRYINGMNDGKFCTGTTTVCATDANCGGAANSCTSNRVRTVTDAGTTGIWRLGDIVTSTPKVQSPANINNYFSIYKDSTYKAFTLSDNYKSYGTAYAGANDGMLHAFNFGIFQEGWTGQNRQFEPARLYAADPTELGKERWGFIPKNMLPYLKYFMDRDYCHLYYVDASPVIFDAAINAPTGCGGDYWNCPKQTTLSGTALDLAQTSWRTVLVGSLRYGGACRGTTAACTAVAGVAGDNCVKTPVDVNESGTSNSIGFSSYFALDITDQDNPVLLWEYARPDLGFTTTGPQFMRIKGRVPNPADGGATSVPDDNLNGRWFVAIASGPTGPIDITKKNFLARSDQNLKVHILDLKTGQLATGGASPAPIDTGIPYAFGGSMLNGKVDYDLDYQDDALYFGYVKKCAATNAVCTANTWTDGGVLRLVTKEDLSGTSLTATGSTALNASNWVWSFVMGGPLVSSAGIGPVSSSISNLEKRSLSGILTEGWLYFGTGRYFFRDDDLGNVTTNPSGNQRILFGVKEPCVGVSGFDPTCTTSLSFYPALGCLTTPVHSGLGTATGDKCGDLVDVTTNVQLQSSYMFGATGLNARGWYLNLENPTNTALEANGTSFISATAERVMTDPVAVPNGAVFFTTFAPNSDVCTFGGSTFLWRLKYDTGSMIQMGGTALIQVSTGEIKELDLKTAFSDKIGKIGSSDNASQIGTAETTGRRTAAMTGVPPVGQGLSLVIPPTPLERIIHIKKK